MFLVLYTTMVVHRRRSGGAPVRAEQLDLAYLALFLGLRVNELVMERLRKAGFSDVRQSHGYLVQHLIERERSITELAERMNVTQQAASKLVTQMIRLGILEADVAEDRRARRIRLSERGWESVKLARRTRRTIDAGLVKAIGRDGYETARRALLQGLDRLGGLQAIGARRIPEPR